MVTPLLSCSFALKLNIVILAPQVAAISLNGGLNLSQKPVLSLLRKSQQQKYVNINLMKRALSMRRLFLMSNQSFIIGLIFNYCDGVFYLPQAPLPTNLASQVNQNGTKAGNMTITLSIGPQAQRHLDKQTPCWPSLPDYFANFVHELFQSSG